MSQDANKALIFELADAVLRSWWTVVAAVCFGIAAALVALNTIPSIYQATTKVRVAPQAIPDSMVQSTVTDTMERRLAEVREAILGRSYMLKLIDAHFTRPESEADQDAMIRALRSRVDIDTIRGSSLFLLSYLDNDRQRAADVANTLTRLFVEQNSEYRRSEAEETQRMFASQAAAALSEYQTIEREYTEFNLQNRNRSEAYLDSNMQQIADLRRDLDAVLLEQKLAEQRLDEYELQIEQGDWNIAVVDGVVVDPAVQRVATLEAELEQLLLTLTESHPDVRAKRHELDRARRASGVPGAAGGSGERSTVDPALAALESRKAGVQMELDQHRATESRIRRELGALRSRIEGTSTVQTRLNELEEKRGAAKQRYEDLKAKAELARGAVSLEASDRGERLEVLEWATAPFRPVSPDPPRLYLLGIAAGLLLFVGPLLARRVLNPIVTSEAGLRAVVEVPVLVSIPRVSTIDSESVRRRGMLLNLGFSVVFVTLLSMVLVILR